MANEEGENLLLLPHSYHPEGSMKDYKENEKYKGNYPLIASGIIIGGIGITLFRGGIYRLFHYPINLQGRKLNQTIRQGLPRFHSSCVAGFDRSGILDRYRHVFRVCLKGEEADTYVQEFVNRGKPLSNTAADFPNFMFGDGSFFQTKLSTFSNGSFSETKPSTKAALAVVHFSHCSIVPKAGKRIDWVLSSLIAEAETLNVALEHALHLNEPVIVISDCLPVVNLVFNPKEPIDEELNKAEDDKPKANANYLEVSKLINKIRSNLGTTDKVVVGWTRRVNNRITDLCCTAVINDKDIMSKEFKPTYLLSELMKKFDLKEYCIDMDNSPSMLIPGRDNLPRVVFRKLKLQEKFKKDLHFFQHALSSDKLTPTSKTSENKFSKAMGLGYEYPCKARIAEKIIIKMGAKKVLIFSKKRNQFKSFRDCMRTSGISCLSIDAEEISEKDLDKISTMPAVLDFGIGTRVLITNMLPCRSFTVDEIADLVIYADLPLEFPGDTDWQIQCVGDLKKKRDVFVICEVSRHNHFEKSMNEIGVVTLIRSDISSDISQQ